MYAKFTLKRCLANGNLKFDVLWIDYYVGGGKRKLF